MIQIILGEKNEKKKDESIFLSYGTVIMQIIVGIFTILAIIYGFGVYQFEKKADFSIKFLTTYESSIFDYEYFLLKRTTEVDIFKSGSLAPGELIDKQYDIRIANSENLLNLVNYLLLTDKITLEKKDELFNKFSSIDAEMDILFKGMDDEVSQNGGKFSYFSDKLEIQKKKLTKDIEDFIQKLLLIVKE